MVSRHSSISRMFAAFALGNLYLLRKRLRPAGQRVSGSTALGKADGPNAAEAGGRLTRRPTGTQNSTSPQSSPLFLSFLSGSGSLSTPYPYTRQG